VYVGDGLEVSFMNTLILKNAVLIDGTGADPVPNSVVVVEGERFREVLSGRVRHLPRNATVLDCKGQTLLPGLIDAHVHMNAVETNILDQHRRNFPSAVVIKSLKVIEDTLHQGFTTVRDCGGIDPGYREALKHGLFPSPRLFVAGRSLSQTGGHGEIRLPCEGHAPVQAWSGLASTICDGVEAVRRASREQLRTGVDHVKIMAGGGCMSPGDEVETSQYSVEEMKAAVFEAESAGKYVAAHAYSSRSIDLCMRAGVRTIEHGNLIDQASSQAMKDAGAYLVPTLVTYEMLSKKGKSLGIPGDNIRKINQAKERGLNALSMAHKTGVKIGSGSDLLGELQGCKGLELALKAKVLGAMGAIVATTRTNAEILKCEKDLGTVEEGKLADLILVKGDPLEDITVFQRYQEKITVIIQGGRVHKNILL
jgi:imidazolonepropionase-like amidohydrolase